METPAPIDRKAPAPQRVDSLAGVLIGTAVGDAMGLPMEGLTARRQPKLFPLPLKHRFLGPWGMVSDDTEHSFMLAQALLSAPDDVGVFQRCLARRFRWWLASLPAGIGFATLRAILRLWAGLPPNRSGVMSAGNGAAMRCALLGVYFAEDRAARRKFVAASTEITHRDPRAGIAALAVAETAAWMTAAGRDPAELMESFRNLHPNAEWSSLVESIGTALALDQSVATFAGQIGVIDGVSGYAFQSIPVAIYAALRHRDNFPAALTEVIACGGDTDTSAAITGALVGARVGTSGIPRSWRRNLLEFPHSLSLLQAVADRLARQTETHAALGPCPYFWPAIPVRNLVFLGTVLGHGLRRLLPPY